MKIRIGTPAIGTLRVLFAICALQNLCGQERPLEPPHTNPRRIPLPSILTLYAEEGLLGESAAFRLGVHSNLGALANRVHSFGLRSGYIVTTCSDCRSIPGCRCTTFSESRTSLGDMKGKVELVVVTDRPPDLSSSLSTLPAVGQLPEPSRDAARLSQDLVIEKADGAPPPPPIFGTMGQWIGPRATLLENALKRYDPQYPQKEALKAKGLGLSPIELLDLRIQVAAKLLEGVRK